MSKMCIGVLVQKNITVAMLRRQIEPHLELYGLGCFFEVSYTEPFMEAFSDGNYLVFSISDNWKFDNCEMFLLPDDCIVNGKRNLVPFKDRMRQLEEILRNIMKIVPRIDLFLGDSGTPYEEFKVYKIGISDFGKVTCQLNQPFFCDIHMIIIRDEGQGDGLREP